MEYGTNLRSAPRRVGAEFVAPYAFVYCDAHPARGGPHQSRGVFVGEYHGATLFACTHRSRRGTVCGALGLELPPRVGPVDGLTNAARYRNRQRASQMARSVG